MSNIRRVRRINLACYFLIAPLLLSLACNSAETDQQISGTERSTDEGVVAAAEDRSLAPRAPAVSQSSEVASSTPESAAGSDTRPGEETAAVEDMAEVSTSTTREMLDEMQRDIDPSATPWDTEVFAEKGSTELKHVGEYFVALASQHSELHTDFLAEGFTCTPLRPTALEETFDDEAITVLGIQGAPQEPAFEGPYGFAQTASTMLEKLFGSTDLRFKFKLFRIEQADDRVKTTVLFEISGITPEGAVQVNAKWNCDWTDPTGDEAPQLLWIGVVDFEEVVVRHQNHKIFSDFTQAVLGELPALEQFSYGIDWWRARLEKFMRIYWDGQNGMSVADVNGDGLDDVYFCEPGGMPNRLLVQSPDGTLKDVSAQSGIDFLDYTRSALFLDYDNDGDQDVVIPSFAQISVFSNDGRGQFTLQANLSVDGETAYSLAGADYDQDGDVDFYACYYRGKGDDETQRLPTPLPFHDARSGGQNRLFRNDGNWQFTDVTDEVGLNHNNDRWSYSAVWEDLDNDGDIDLYVVNDYGRNNLYRNENGHFHDEAGPANAEDTNFGMSGSVGDFDRDGWMDVYISNMFSAAGGRVTFQPQFKSDQPEELKAAYQQMARGNTLLHNKGDGTFEDVSVQMGVSTGRWAWTSLFADLNNDGWQDIVVANGFVTGKIADDL